MKKFTNTNLSPSSKDWVKRQARDPFVKLAKNQSYRSRAAYKLLQLNDRDRFLRCGQRVVDLGAAPGGWLQVLVDKVYEPNCNLAEVPTRVFAIDLLPVTGLAGAKILMGDFHAPEMKAALEKLIRESVPADAGLDPLAKLDVVLSDLSPNISGVRASDNARAEAMWHSTLMFAHRWLNVGGSMVCKMFHSTEAEDFVRKCKVSFTNVWVRKPDASRDESREVFLVAKGYKGAPAEPLHV